MTLITLYVRGVQAETKRMVQGYGGDQGLKDGAALDELVEAGYGLYMKRKLVDKASIGSGPWRKSSLEALEALNAEERELDKNLKELEK